MDWNSTTMPYRRYAYKLYDGRGTVGVALVHGEAGEKEAPHMPSFIGWIDDDWVTHSVSVKPGEGDDDVEKDPR